MKFSTKVIIAIVAAVIMGYIFPAYLLPDFFGRSWLAIIPWGVVGIAACWLAQTRKQSIILGIIYMAVLTVGFIFSFIHIGSSVGGVILFFIADIIGSLVTGTIMGWLTFRVRMLLKR